MTAPHEDPRTVDLTTRLRAWRTEQGFSLQEMADLTGVSTAMLSRLETGGRAASARTKVLMARRLSVPIRTLFEVEPLDLGPEEEAQP